MDAPATFARAIAADRVALGWTQQDLADASGLPVGVIARIETGHRETSLRESLALADALDTTLRRLLARADASDLRRFG